METIRTSGASVTVYDLTQQNVPEDLNRLFRTYL